MVHSFNYPARIKLNNVALFGEKESIDTIHDDLLLLRIIKDVSFSYLSINQKENYTLVSLTRYRETVPRFVIILPYQYQDKFIDYLSHCSEENPDKTFDFHYSHPTLLDALPAIDINVQVWDAIDSNNLQRIRRVLKSPLQLPILSDDIENTTHLGQDSTSSNNRHTSHIRICFHS